MLVILVNLIQINKEALMMKCIECGSTNKVYTKQFGVPLCPNCTRMWKEHPQHDLPEPGEIKLDELGRPICHICGRAFHKLLTHAKQRHKISAEEYKTKFGLNSGKGVVSGEFREKARQNVLDNYNVGVTENLINKGTKTRFKTGHKGRTKDQVRLQAKNQLKEHIQNIRPHNQ